MYDEQLAERVRFCLAASPTVTERQMFGGVAFLLSGNMACGIVGSDLMVRTGPERYEGALAQPHARPMEFTGRAMRGMVFVGKDGLDDQALGRWVAMGVTFAGGLPAKRPEGPRSPSGRRVRQR